MKRILVKGVFFLAFIGFAACSGSKKVSVAKVESGNKEVQAVFVGDKYKSDDNFFRAYGVAKNEDQGNARDMAELRAKGALTSYIKTMLEAFGKLYLGVEEVGGNSENKLDYKRRIIDAAQELVRDIRVQDEKLFYNENDKKFTYHVVLELSKKAMLGNLRDKLSNDERLKLKFDEKQFDDFIKNYKEGVSNTNGN